MSEMPTWEGFMIPCLEALRDGSALEAMKPYGPDDAVGRINGKFKVEIEAVRAGYTSWQKQTRSVDRAGYGLNYGKYYGGI